MAIYVSWNEAEIGPLTHRFLYHYIYIPGMSTDKKPLEWIGSSHKDLMALPAEAVFVLHCFQKKSKRGIATPKEDMDIIHARLKIAQAFVKELRK